MGNNELEYYTNSPDNASVANGKLTITAKKEEEIVIIPLPGW